MLLKTHVAFVDWTVVDRTGVGNYGGTIIPRDLAESASSLPNGVREGSSLTNWQHALRADGRWSSGPSSDVSVKFLDIIEIPDLLVSASDNLRAYDGNIVPLDSRETARSAVMRTINKIAIQSLEPAD